MSRFVQGWCLIGRHYGLVQFIGPVESHGMRAPVYACEGCCEYMRQYIRANTAQRDQRPAV
ncbi:hypothetical protein [Streptomyces sp. 1222.5]|uniref:hypothetical protein n=1 Tax=Streptomyces sp. 1222.5 TaxID=1881026 RepID=UPI003EB74068